MKNFLKFLGIGAAIIVVVILAGLIYFNSAYPDVEPAKDIKVEITPARLERGKYLFHNVAMCIDCHSERDWTKYSGPVKAGTIGKGGDKFDEMLGLPGTIYAKNITPAALGKWTDGEIIRAITTGVNKDGDALFPIMPYYFFNNLSEEDLYSIVAYLRTLEPVESTIPDKELNFPVNFLERTLPLKTYTPKESVKKSDKVKYGKYLITIALCGECHTPFVEGKPDMERQFAGGNEFSLPWGVVRPANITPDKETGIGNWSKEDFIAKFKHHNSESSKNIPVTMNEFNSVMPWTLYAGMTEEDLGAIYDYLKTVTPAKNIVQKWSPLQTKVANK
jgi:hypothetical protein